MCKETFLRLPPQKRERFLDAAWAEFTRVKFSNASINQIVQRAGIPRGSFYQYFEDKEDLFSYLVRELQKDFFGQYGQILRQCGGDMFLTQLTCFDRFIQIGRQHKLLGRCVKLFQINPGMESQVMENRLDEVILADVSADLDTSALRRSDAAFVSQVFSMTLYALGGAVLESLVHPEQTQANREKLERILEIIQYGSIKPSASPEGEGGIYEN